MKLNNFHIIILNYKYMLIIINTMVILRFLGKQQQTYTQEEL